MQGVGQQPMRQLHNVRVWLPCVCGGLGGANVGSAHCPGVHTLRLLHGGCWGRASCKVEKRSRLLLPGASPPHFPASLASNLASSDSNTPFSAPIEQILGIDALRAERVVTCGADRTCRVWKIAEESQLIFRCTAVHALHKLCMLCTSCACRACTTPQTTSRGAFAGWGAVEALKTRATAGWTGAAGLKATR